MIATQSNVIDSREVAMQLWKNEVDRTIADRFVPHNHKDCTVCTILYSPVHLNCTVHIADRFVADADKEWFNTELNRVVEVNFGEDDLAVVKENRYSPLIGQ